MWPWGVVALLVAWVVIGSAIGIYAGRAIAHGERLLREENARDDGDQPASR